MAVILSNPVVVVDPSYASTSTVATTVSHHGKFKMGFLFFSTVIWVYGYSAPQAAVGAAGALP